MGFPGTFPSAFPGGMTITERALSAATVTAAAAQTLSVNPTGMVSGDWMEAELATTGGTVTHAAPAGWTQVGSTVFHSGVGLSVWRKFAGANEAGPYQFDTGGAGNRRIALSVRAFSGVNTTNPLDDTVKTVSASTALNLTHPASTSQGAGRVWVLATAKTTALGGTSTLNIPAGFTETTDHVTAHATLANINAGLHYKTGVGSGSTGTQQVTSPDTETATWVGLSFVLVPSGAATAVTADATVAQTLELAAAAQVVVIAGTPAATATSPSKSYGGGFQDTGCFAPPGVGHDWYAAAHGDVFGTHISNDGITWRPSNKGIGGPHHAIRTLRGSAIEGSQTVANRLWAWCGQSPDGDSGGNLVKGTYSTSTGLVSWTNFVQANDGPAGGTTDYGHPRMVGRLLALDEANDTAYGCSRNGIVRISGINGAAGSATITHARALAGEDVTGLVLDPTNPQVGWATVRRSYTGKTNAPGVYRLTNLRSGTVTAVREAFTDCQDLCLVDTGTTRYVFVAAMNQGIRRWTVSADITTGWVDVTNDYEPGAAVVGTGAAGIDAIWDGAQIQVLAVNAGNANLTNGGGYTRLGLNAAPDWVNESPGWTVNMVPWGETDPWWLSVLIPGLMLNGTGYDSGVARIDPANPNIGMLWGRSGIWRSQNAWQTWRPAVKGTVGVMSWAVAARPGFANQALHDGGDWSVIQSTNLLTATSKPVRPRPGGCMGLMWTADGAEVAYAAGDPFAGASEAAVFVSTNGGTTWVDQGLPVGIDAHGVAIGYNSSGQRVLLTVYRTGIYRKVGTGGWSVVSTLTVPQDSQAHNPHFCWPQNTNSATSGRRAFVYCTGHAGLLRSDDWGATWTTIHSLTNSGESAGAITYDPAAINTLYYTVSGSANDGLWKITNAHATPTATKIGPTMNAPGPCAADPDTGVVYVATTALESGGAKLYASPSNNPGAATTFEDITDAQWEHGPWAPCDMSVTSGGQILVSNRQGGVFVASRAGTGGAAVHNADAILDHDLALIADAQVVSATPGIVTATATIAMTSGLVGVAEQVSAPPTADGTAAEADELWFNGTWWPRAQVIAGLGGTLDPGPTYLHLNIAPPGLDVALLGGATPVDLGGGNGRNVRSIRIQGRGKSGPLETATPATATIVLNNASGAYDPDNTASPYAGLGIGTPIDIRAERPIGTIWRRFYGEVISVSLDAGDDPTVTLVCADGLEKLARAQLGAQATPVGGGETSGARLHRILDGAAYPTILRAIDTGYNQLAPTTLGDFALELARQVEATEIGWLFCDGEGRITFYDRHRAASASRSTSVQAVFSDTGLPGEPALVELEVEWSRDRTFNDAHVTRDPIPNPPQAREDTDTSDDAPVEQVATDPTTQAVWGTLSLPNQAGQLLRNDFEALATAQYLLDRFNHDTPIIRQIRVNALARDLWDVLLPLGLADRVAVRRDYGPRTILEELLIEQMAEEINSDPPTWELVFDTGRPPPAPQLFLLNQSPLNSGRLGW